MRGEREGGEEREESGEPEADKWRQRERKNKNGERIYYEKQSLWLS